ncbi:MAG: TIGR01777 family oxidoreductase [Byssovorax sp.]
MKRVLITGGSGFIGKKLSSELLLRGDQVTVLTRNPGKARAHLPAAVRCAAWDPDKDGAWFDELSVVDAVVHLAGESVAKRWNDKTKAAIERSRYQSTRLLVEAIGKAKHKPSVLVSASATGYYGPRRPDEEVDEQSEPGTDFLAGVCKLWEEAARGAEAHGVRAAQVRLGVVLGEGGGALEKMILPSPSMPLFVGGPIGDGTQVIPWVHRDDVVGLLLLALDNPEVKGPMNAVSPNPADSREMAKAISAVTNCPMVPTPAFALKAAMGEAASIVLTGQRVVPRRAIELGYEFRAARLIPALESILGPR